MNPEFGPKPFSGNPRGPQCPPGNGGCGSGSGCDICTK